MLFEVDIQKRIASAGRVFELAVRFSADSDRIAVFGPSGAGKSLLLQMLAGLVQPEGGFIRVDGATWFDAALRIDMPARDRRIGYVFQHYALFPHRTVAQNIAFSLATPLLGRMPMGARERVGALLEMHDAEDVAACSDTVLALAHGRIVEPRDAPVPLPPLPLRRSVAPRQHRLLAP